MIKAGGRRMLLGACCAIMVSSALVVTPASAQDFFSALFGAITGQPPERALVPFGHDGDDGRAPVKRARSSGGGQAFCVRTCDGRHFPISAASNESRAATCNSFCPASETKIFYGSSIDHAASENGKAYSAMENAFRYRNEIVAGCTCNGKDTFGLAKVDIKDDPTLRKGDLVAGEDGLLVAGRRADRRGTSLNFSPASAALSAKFSRVPVAAAE